MAVLLASLSSLTWGISDFVGGMTTRRVRVHVVVLWSQAVGLAVGLIGTQVVEGSLSAGAVGWGAAGGLGGSVGILALYEGLARGRAALVAPVAAVVGAGIPVSYGVGNGDRPGVAAWLGIAVAVPALWLVSRQRGSESTAGLGAGVLAGMGFGAFFVLLGHAPDDGGLWPLVPARLASIAMVSLLLFARRESFRLEHTSRAVVAGLVAAGAGDMLANMLYLSAVQRGVLSLVAVLSSLYPAMTVILAKVFGERVAGSQWLGVTLSLLAVALIVA